ncbi:MAG: DUF4349 domain-containing protein [Caldicoprobacterales bacterium]|jgi:hypothetical protein|nr:DUF4349 domain-containing protein [Clostridiales bacterium]
MKKTFLLLVSIVLILLIAAGCSSKSARDEAPSEQSIGNSSYGESINRGGEKGSLQASEDLARPPADTAGGSEEFMPETENIGGVNRLVAGMGSKIIKSGAMTVETLEFEETTSAIQRRVQEAGGFIASSNIQGWSREDAKYKPMRTASYKVRIPSEKFEHFMNAVGELGNVIRSESWGEDVSAQYFDTEARLRSLEIQEERLLTILSRAEELKDIIELERELSTVRYEIESLTGTLRKYDNLVAYSTLEIEVREVERITESEKEPVTLWEKIGKRFRDSIEAAGRFAEGVLLFFISAIPFLFLLGIVLLIPYGIIRLIRKKSLKNIN